MTATRVERQIGAHKMIIESGKIAKQAAGSVVVTYGETMVLAAVVSGPSKPGTDFFPLTVDYREKMYAAGKFPGGFFKREGRPSTREILTMRLIDRPLRPLFTDGFIDEVLIQISVLSYDQENDPDVLSIVAAAAACAVSPLPLECSAAGVRVARVNGEYVVNPTQEQLAAADSDFVLAGHKDAVNMIEIGARELPEQAIMDGIKFGHNYIVEICDMIDELKKKCGKPQAWTPQASPDALLKKLRQTAGKDLREARMIAGKLERKAKLKEIYDRVIAELCPPDVAKPEYEQPLIVKCLDQIEGEILVDMILESGIRSDGRRPDQLRQITSEVGVLPRAHGSSLFTRGETQAMVITTLGTGRDEQVIDGLLEEYSKKFMLHYNFPPFSVGEVKRVGAVSRREIGHGSLAERCLEPVLPSPEKFPYTVRVVSDILESNGSSSMASVCGGTLALMDAGVPISQPVAGISIGMVHDDKRHSLLVDIIGEEDHFGDMDFKIAGTQHGVTGVQLDLKARGLSFEIMAEAFALAKKIRIEILKNMLSTLRRPRETTSPYAPRILVVKIDPEKIGKVIGPGGKGIKGIEAESGAIIEINDDGTIQIACVEMKGAERAREMIEAVTEEVKVGAVYTGRVTSIKDFGAFVEVRPGQDGLVHISELSSDYVRSVTDVCNIGDMLKVKVIGIDPQGRIKLSVKALQAESEEGDDQAEPEELQSTGRRGR